MDTLPTCAFSSQGRPLRSHAFTFRTGNHSDRKGTLRLSTVILRQRVEHHIPGEELSINSSLHVGLLVCSPPSSEVLSSVRKSLRMKT